MTRPIVRTVSLTLDLVDELLTSKRRWQSPLVPAGAKILSYGSQAIIFDPGLMTFPFEGRFGFEGLARSFTFSPFLTPADILESKHEMKGPLILNTPARCFLEWNGLGDPTDRITLHGLMWITYRG